MNKEISSPVRKIDGPKLYTYQPNLGVRRPISTIKEPDIPVKNIEKHLMRMQSLKQRQSYRQIALINPT